MQLEQLLRLAQAIRNEGDSVMAQFRDVVIGGESLDEQNPNALSALLPILDMADRYGVEGAAELENEIKNFLNGA